MHRIIARTWRRAAHALRGEGRAAGRQAPTFADLMRDIDDEARVEGPEAVEELRQLKEQYALEGQELLRRGRNRE